MRLLRNVLLFAIVLGIPMLGHAQSSDTVRLSITNFETLIANATRRALRLGEPDVVPRVSDLEALGERLLEVSSHLTSGVSVDAAGAAAPTPPQRGRAAARPRSPGCASVSAGPG